MPSSNVNTLAEHLQAVRRRLVASASGQGTGLFLRHFRHSAGQTPGWVVLRQRHLSTVGARPDVLGLTQLTLAAAGDSSCVLKLDVYETASSAAAQALMIELLTGFQALPARYEIGRDIGDADLMLPGDRVRLFARGNLVVSLVNAGARILAVGDTARTLDRFITAAPRAALSRRGRASPEALPPGAMVRYTVREGTLRQNDDGTLTVDGGSETPTMDALDEQDDVWYPVAGGESAPPVGGPRRKRR